MCVDRTKWGVEKCFEWVTILLCGRERCSSCMTWRIVVRGPTECTKSIERWVLCIGYSFVRVCKSICMCQLCSCIECWALYVVANVAYCVVWMSCAVFVWFHVFRCVRGVYAKFVSYMVRVMCARVCPWGAMYIVVWSSVFVRLFIVCIVCIVLYVVLCSVCLCVSLWSWTTAWPSG